MLQNIIIVINLIILESLLSVDNVAVLALLVKHLGLDEQKKALYYGLLGAFLMRFTCLLVSSYLLSFVWLKFIGGGYLLYLCMAHFSKSIESAEENKSASDSSIYNFLFYRLGISMFISTVVLVEFMDLVFSIDNVFAAVAMSNKYWVLLTGVAIGIVSVRFVATWFLKVLKSHPSLETSAFIVIGLLGVKLNTSAAAYYLSLDWISAVMAQHWFDIVFSIVMLGIFIVPLLRDRNKSLI